jgi:hypothetical protein
MQLNPPTTDTSDTNCGEPLVINPRSSLILRSPVCTVSRGHNIYVSDIPIGHLFTMPNEPFIFINTESWNITKRALIVGPHKVGQFHNINAGDPVEEYLGPLCFTKG